MASLLEGPSLVAPLAVYSTLSSHISPLTPNQENIFVLPSSPESESSFFFFFFFSFFLVFLGPHPWHMEVLRLGNCMQLLATPQPQQHGMSRICELDHSSWQHRTFNPLSEGSNRTCILMDSSRVHNLLRHKGNSDQRVAFIIL